MSFKKKIWLAVGFSIPLAIFGCMKTNYEDNTITAPKNIVEPGTDLDANHGGARMVLPEIDFLALNKQGASAKDTLPAAWFELTISGAGMVDMNFQYPLVKKTGNTFEIKGIPSGISRSFSGRLLNRSRQITHEGTTIADIQAGILTDLQLFLAKVSGSANVCVVIQGQKLPACAVDTVPPPPPPDSALVSHCWYVGSDSIHGRLSLFDQPQGLYSGSFISNNGIRLPVTTWAKIGDTLSFIVIRPSMSQKWIFKGILHNQFMWNGTVTGGPMEPPFSFYGKPISCSDTLIEPPKDTLPPPEDTTKAMPIPSPKEKTEITRCMEMQIDYGNGCELNAFANMSFLSGKIVKGYIRVADRPERVYTQIVGKFDESRIHIESVLPNSESSKADSMTFDGSISSNRIMAKGNYIRLPIGKTGIWSMKTVACESWTPRYTESSCIVRDKILK